MTPPLAGRTILVTRPRELAEAFASRLRELGAEAIVAPTIEVEPPDPGGALDAAVRDAAGGRARWLVFTSAAGVAAWWSRAGALGVGPPAAKIAVAEDSTAEELRDRGVEPDLVPHPVTTAALAEAFPRGRGTVVLALPDIATAELEDAVAGKGWKPVRVDAYRVRPATSVPEPARRAIEQHEVDAVVFTSPPEVEGYLSIAVAARRPPAVCIGAATAAAAERVGFRVAAVADPHTDEGLLEALLAFGTDQV